MTEGRDSRSLFLVRCPNSGELLLPDGVMGDVECAFYFGHEGVCRDVISGLTYVRKLVECWVCGGVACRSGRFVRSGSRLVLEPSVSLEEWESAMSLLDEWLN